MRQSRPATWECGMRPRTKRLLKLLGVILGLFIGAMALVMAASWLLTQGYLFALTHGWIKP